MVGATAAVRKSVIVFDVDYSSEWKALATKNLVQILKELTFFWLWHLRNLLCLWAIESNNILKEMRRAGLGLNAIMLVAPLKVDGLWQRDLPLLFNSSFPGNKSGAEVRPRSLASDQRLRRQFIGFKWIYLILGWLKLTWVMKQGLWKVVELLAAVAALPL